MGAAVMPPEVKRLALTFASKNKGGHMGPRYATGFGVGRSELGLTGARKFWKNYLPRLKWHNPQVQMDVTRDSLVGGPATLTIEFGG